jgi:hypothetical protein
MRALILIFVLMLGTSAAEAQPYPQVVTGVSNINTYSASNSFASTSIGDLFCVYGSATKVVKVKGIRVTGTGGTGAVLLSMAIVRRSTLGSGGGLTAITPVASDPLNSAATASAMYFTSTPTPGTLVGNVRNRYMTFSGTTAAVAGSEGLFQFSVYWDQPQVLRGTANGICAAAPSAGSSWAIDAEWSEE